MELIIPRIQQAAAAALKSLWNLDLPPAELVVQHTARDHTGDYTIVLFPLMKHKLGALPEIGQRLGDALAQSLGIVARHELVKGFLNLTLTDAYWGEVLRSLSATPGHGLTLPPRTGEKLVVEYASPNTNKPIHLGHLRNIFLGAATAAICKAAGIDTSEVCLFNDKGIHVCKSMLAWQRFAHGETPESASIKGDHFVGKWYVRFDTEYRREVQQLVDEGMEEETARQQAPLMQEAQEMYRQWEAGQPEVLALWQQMNQWVYSGMEQTYARIHIRFDKYYYESDTWKLGRQVVDEGLESGVFTRQPDGSVWIDLTDAGLDRKLVLRRDGTSVYITQDLGTADLRYQDYQMNRSVYVIGNEQDYHMQVLREILRRLGRPYAEGVYHLSYGMVDLPSGKMKSREGTVVDADDLLDEMYRTAKEATEELGKTEGMDPANLTTLYETLALGALKYYLLKVDPPKRMLFNPQESIDFKGHTGTFIQYTHARIHGILRKAAESHPRALESTLVIPATLLPLEKALIQRLSDWQPTLADAAAGYDPSLVANYCYELSKDYSRFHYEVPVLKAETPELLVFRLQLNAQVARTLRLGMALLGIDMPERM
ncbi:MAG: arginine--tRNA ligase [Bacteroidetes bacterium]|nr:arginine--tRNA ligase [Bacteroidota bacterium]